MKLQHAGMNVPTKPVCRPAPGFATKELQGISYFMRLQSVMFPIRPGVPVKSLLTPLLLCAGCFASYVAPPPLPLEVQRLVATADRLVELRTTLPDPSTRVGHQYLLFLFPLTRVYPQELSTGLETQLQLDAASRGYRLVRGKPAPGKGGLQLSVEVAEISLNGYDLLFVRRPSASVTLRGSLTGARTRSC